MYSMKEVCELTGLTYETLKFYCNQGLVPTVERNVRNQRIFSEQSLAWIQGLVCLRKCRMSIPEMKRYTALCQKGKTSIPERRTILNETYQALLKQRNEIDEALAYIQEKQKFYTDVESGTIPYTSNLALAHEEQ